MFRSMRCENFNPRSHEGSDGGIENKGRGSKISILAPTRGATSFAVCVIATESFQSSLPRGERLTRSSKGSETLYFNPRSHEGSDRTPFQLGAEEDDFNPRSHEGSDCHWTDSDGVIYISILAPTRGATHPLAHLVECICISILAPTRGATHTESQPCRKERISILAPTRGATQMRICLRATFCYFNPRSHEGSDSRASSTIMLNMSFQSSLPRGERQISDCQGVKQDCISILAPTRGATHTRPELTPQ